MSRVVMFVTVGLFVVSLRSLLERHSVANASRNAAWALLKLVRLIAQRLLESLHGTLRSQERLVESCSCRSTATANAQCYEIQLRQSALACESNKRFMSSESKCFLGRERNTRLETSTQPTFMCEESTAFSPPSPHMSLRLIVGAK